MPADLDYQDYFSSRNVGADFYPDSPPQAYLTRIVDQLRPQKILDFGCGFGQTLVSLRKIGRRTISRACTKYSGAP